MLRDTRSHIDTSVPEAMGSIPEGPLTKGGVLRADLLKLQNRRAAKRKAYRLRPMGGAATVPIRSDPPISVEGNALREAIARQGLVLSEEEWAALLEGAGGQAGGSLGPEELRRLLAVPVRGGDLRAEHGVLRQPWDEGTPSASPREEVLPHFAKGRQQDEYEVPSHVTRFPLFPTSGADLGATAPL